MEEILTTFLVSVIAGVVSYYICKWLGEFQSVTQLEFYTFLEDF